MNTVATNEVNGAVSGRPKTLEETKAWMRAKLVARAHPMNMVAIEEALPLIDSLPALDGASWAAIWGGAGDAALEQAAAVERDKGSVAASPAYMRASGLYFMGRFPCPNHPDMLRCAEKEDCVPQRGV